MSSELETQSVGNNTVKNLNPLNYDDCNSSRDDFGVETHESATKRSVMEPEPQNEPKYMFI